MGKGYLVVEGHGEDGAVPNLVNRLWADLALPHIIWNAKPLRGTALHQERGVLQLCDLLRRKPDCDVALFLRDEDDGCPKDRGPEAAEWLRRAELPFASAFVLFHREYETLFLPCLPLMAGKPIVDPNGNRRQGVREGATFGGDPQARRDAKGAVSSFMPPGRAYKPTIDQLALTRMLDFGTLRASGLPCFTTLENALRFLSQAAPGDVYPPAPG
jgi:Domain of unknown function (DUF4276)